MKINEQVQNRWFQVWDFWVSHSQLLLRSPKDDEYLTNIDVRFRGVEYIDLPTSFNFTFENAVDDDRAKIKKKLGRDLDKSEKVFVLKCDQNRHYVVAFVMEVEENEVDIFDSTLQRQW